MGRREPLAYINSFGSNLTDDQTNEVLQCDKEFCISDVGCVVSRMCESKRLFCG